MRVILVAVFAVVLCPSVFAQSPTGSIGGIVFDPDAKTIPGAEIIVVNDLTRVQYETKTNDLGIYAVPNLPPGPYRVQASKVGFKTLIKPDLILNVQEAITLNFTLPIGATSITVTVEGGAPMVDTTDATVSTIVDRQFAENLPMNGRSFQTLIDLTPGVVVTPSTANDSGQFSVNGQRAASNYWMVDGVSANVGVGASTVAGNGLGGTLGSFSALGGTNSLVSVDAMQEFRIQTSTFAPEFGRTPGAQISIVTRSGTNQFHGTIFDYLRNDALDANNWFANSAGLQKPQERQNDFGVTVGGPIAKDKTFFFFSYEGLRLRLPQTTLSTVPDIAARQNAVAAMQPFLHAFPVPNGSDNPATGVAQFNASYSNPATLDAYSLRLDHTFGGRWTIWGRYNHSPSELDDRGLNGGVGVLSDRQLIRITTDTATAGVGLTIAPGITNDLRINYSHVHAYSEADLDTFGGAIPLTALPFPTGVDAKNGFFEMVVTGLSVGRTLEVGRNAQNTQKQINVVDGLSWQKGAHSLKFGGDFRRLAPIRDPGQYEQAAVFGSIPATMAGNSIIGIIEGFNQAKLLFRNLGMFAQDTWHVIPRLTLTYGLRWDVDFSPASLNQLRLPAVTGYNLADLSQLAIAPPGTPPFRTRYNNFAPRFGAAYQISQSPSWQTVLRGGAGVFYDLASSEVGNQVSLSAPPFATNKNIFGQPFPFGPSQILPEPIPPSPGAADSIYVFNPNLKLPYTLEWNFAVEQVLGSEQTLSATYLGASGNRLLQTTQVLKPAPNPTQAEADFIDNTAHSNYQALQIQFQRRLSHGLQMLASYTWSHSIDDASAGSYGNPANLGVPGGKGINRGPSDFDIRHSFTAGLTYDVPSWRGYLPIRLLLRDWSAESFILARSAAPLDIADTNFSFLNGGTFTNIRPDVVAGQTAYLYGGQCAAVFQGSGDLLPGQSCPGGKGLNPAAFTDPPIDPSTGLPTRQGNLSRNALRGFGAVQWDFALHRDFAIHESVRVQFRAEMFNVLNHPNFGPPSTRFGEAGFGLSSNMLGQSLSSGNTSSGAFNPLYQIGGPRSIQLALKLVF